MEQVAIHLQFLSPRHIPDVPEDVDSVMDHLNDPNYDLRRRSQSSIASFETLVIDKEGVLSAKFSTKGADLDTESQVQSPRSSEMSDFNTFDECENQSMQLWSYFG